MKKDFGILIKHRFPHITSYPRDHFSNHLCWHNFSLDRRSWLMLVISNESEDSSMKDMKTWLPTYNIFHETSGGEFSSMPCHRKPRDGSDSAGSVVPKVASDTFKLICFQMWPTWKFCAVWIHSNKNSLPISLEVCVIIFYYYKILFDRIVFMKFNCLCSFV